MKTLKPLPLRTSDYSDVRKQLEAIFYKIVFKPVVDLLAPHNAQVRVAAKELRNAVVAPVVAAIRAGRIQYADDTFSGDFNAEISKALRSYGAQYNKQQKTFTIVPQDLPVEVLAASNEYAQAAKDLHDQLDTVLKGIERNLEQLTGEVDASMVISTSEEKFNRAYAEAIGKEELSDRAKRELASDYSTNMKLWIQKWCKETIQDLRVSVAQNAKQGYRFDKLVDRVQNRYDVSKTKAEFLSRQETALFTSKHRQQRFEDAGITSYVWQTAGDVNVRDSHKKLNGKIFEYANPPIVDESTGRRANAGEDFNCRCVANPILPGVLADAKP